MSKLSPTLIGIICAVTASLSFSTNDMGIKLLSGDYPLHQIVFFRSCLGLLFTVAIFMPVDGGIGALKTKRLKMHLLRGFCVVFANMTYFTGLASLPISEATAIFFISPLVITAFAFLFLGEKAGPFRWTAVVVGLVGVIVMVRPGGDTFQFAALLPLAAAVGYATLHTLTRKMGATEKASTMAFYIQLSFIFVSGSIGLAFGDGRFAGSSNPSIEFVFRAWILPESRDIAVILMVGFASAIGGYLISQAYRQAEASIIAPFEYVAMPMAIIWGMTLFGEWPDTIAWTGIALIIGAGLFVFWREMMLNRIVASERPMPRQR